IGDGPFRATIQELIDRYELQSRVCIVGWKDSTAVRNEILNSRALVLASFAEGLPVVFMEALALRRPVISTYVAGIPELVQPGECGWLVAAGAVDSLTHAMKQALSAPVAQLQCMGRKGAAAVARDHDASL